MQTLKRSQTLTTKLISRGETASLQTLAGRVAVLGIVAAKQQGSGGVSPRA